MEVEPKRVLQTSPDRLDEVPKRFIIRYPRAREPTEIMAMALSPLILAFCPVRSSKTAQTTVMAITRGISFLIWSTAAMDMAPKATWESPSPMKEKRLSTSVTPSSEEQRAISIPTNSA